MKIPLLQELQQGDPVCFYGWRYCPCFCHTGSQISGSGAGSEDRYYAVSWEVFSVVYRFVITPLR